LLIGLRLKRSKQEAPLKAAKPKVNLWERIRPVLTGKGRLPDDWKTRLEEALLAADVGYKATEEILNSFKGIPERPESFEQSREALARQVVEILQRPLQIKADRFHQRQVCLICGVNGSGKTTTIVKLARYIQGLGKRVLLAACDTFRAGAISQLEILAERSGCDLIKGQPKQSPSAILFDALRTFEAKGYDSLLVDTAWRLDTKTPLIEELKKMKRIAENGGVSVLVLLVIDANQGQNAMEQARRFVQDLGVDGVILTKMDGTAKGGVVIAIAMELAVPVFFLGVGEGLDDLLLFDPKAYTHALLSSKAHRDSS
jgi:fused signal recognition particle receptor